MLGRRTIVDRYLQSGELLEVFTTAFHLYADYFLRQSQRFTGGYTNDRVAIWLAELAAAGSGDSER
jgi:hypothetical protein